MLPDVLHVVLSGVHVPLVHLPPQHCPSAVHAALSDAHCLSEHVALTHENWQHSSLVLHAVPAALHLLTEATHSFDAGSQFAVQHSALDAHVPPAALHVGAVRGSPSVAACPSLAPPPSLVSAGEVSLPQPPKIGAASAAGTKRASAASESLFTMDLVDG